MTKDQILAALPKLKQSDLKEVTAVANGLLNKDEDPAVRDWFQAICNVCQVQQSFPSIKNTQFGKALVAFAPDAEVFLESVLTARTNTMVGKITTRFYLCRLLEKALKRQKIPPTRTTLAQHLPRLSEVVDDAFPEWRKAGMFNTVLNRIIGGRHD